MKYLYLIRHAKSSWADPALSDFERPLNKRGKRDAPFMGKRLAQYDKQPEIIFSSPAKRALKTARLIGAECGFKKNQIIVKKSLYTFSFEPIVEVVRRTEDSVNIQALVGHNHGLTECAELLSSTALDNIPTCGIVLIEFNLTSWNLVETGKGTLVMFDYPKQHAVND